VSEARHNLAIQRSELAEHAAALEETIDDLVPSYQRYRIGRPLEVVSLIALGCAETVVADTVVQALGLTATATDLIAAAVGGAATGLAWLVGHEWAISRDPEAAAAGQRGWLRSAAATSGAFLLANFGVRLYYGVLAEKVEHLGKGFIAPVLSASLLTAVTAALMVVTAFITAHAETSRVAELRARLRRVRGQVRSLDSRVGVLHAEGGTTIQLPTADQSPDQQSAAG